LKSCKSFSFWKNLFMKLPQDYIPFFFLWKWEFEGKKKPNFGLLGWRGQL
jgi:hypothetical protein